MFFGQASAGRSTDLNGLEVRTIPDPAPDIENDFAQGGPHGNFDQPGIFNVACQSKSFGSWTPFRSDGLVPGSTPIDDQRHIGKRFHVVQHRGFAIQPLLNSSRRLHSGHAALTFDRRGQCTALAANKGAGSLADFDVKRAA